MASRSAGYGVLMATAPPQALRDLAARYSVAQRRTVDVALALFAEYGVGGTSLHMIADALGVTKAAVYHQFQTKDAIVLAVMEVQLQPIEAIVDEARDRPPDEDRREYLLGALIDFVVANRRSLSTLQSDPVLFRLLSEYRPSLDLWTRVFDILLGGETGDAALVRSAVLSAAIGTVAYPIVIDLDNDVLRAELHRIMHGLLFGSR
jgi:AcrR family transcriptional regulator